MYFSMNHAGNKKTLIPTTTSSRQTCPDSCPLKDEGCYANNFPMSLAWDRLTRGETKAATSYQVLVRQIKRLPKGQLWRHNAAGDLLHDNGVIDKEALSKLVAANRGRRGFTFTHHKLTSHNVLSIQSANKDGFTVNVSTESPEEAAKLFYAGLPAVTIVPENTPVRGLRVPDNPDGVRLVICPAQTKKKICLVILVAYVLILIGIILLHLGRMVLKKEKWKTSSKQ